MSEITFAEAAAFVKLIVDDTGNPMVPGQGPHAKVRMAKITHKKGRRQHDGEFHHRSRLVGWVTDPIDPFIVAVHSYLDTPLSDSEAEDIASDYLEESGWFGAFGRRKADIII